MFETTNQPLNHITSFLGQTAKSPKISWLTSMISRKNHQFYSEIPNEISGKPMVPLGPTCRCVPRRELAMILEFLRLLGSNPSGKPQKHQGWFTLW
jgi:hypothetical protein